MARKSVTVNYSEAEFEQLTNDAQEAGHDSAYAFVKELVANRGEMPEARLDPQSEQKVLKMQGAMELLQNQLDKALSGKAGGLSGTPEDEKPASQKSIEKQINARLDEEREKRDAKETKEKYEQLKKDYEKLEKDCDKLEDELEDLTKSSGRGAILERLAPGLAGAVVKGFSEHFPGQAESLVSALAGIAGFSGAAPALQAGSQQDETSLLVSEINNALTDEQKPLVHAIINHLIDYPQLIGQVEKAVRLGAEGIVKAQNMSTAAL